MILSSEYRGFRNLVCVILLTYVIIQIYSELISRIALQIHSN